MEQSKRCPDCLQNLPVSQFRKRSPKSEILQSYCKECEKKRWRKWREKNLTQEQARTRKYHQDNRDRLLKEKKIKYWDNPDAFKLKINESRRNNAEKHKTYVKSWNDNNREKLRTYAIKSSGKRKSAIAFAISTKELLKLRSMPCFECGTKLNIHIDHIVPLARGGTNGIGNLMPLCAKCNMSKGKKTLTEWRKWKRINNAG